MAPWKPPAMLAIIALLVVGIIAVSRAMGDDGSTGQSAVVWAMVVVALALMVLVSTVGSVRRPFVVTGLVMVSVALVSLAPLGAAISTTLYREVVVKPVCERLVTDDTRYDGVSRNADGFTSIERYFTRRLECHYRTEDPAVPEGIPTRVDLADERLAGSSDWLYRLGNALATVVGFFLPLLLAIPLWRWWFHSMMREVRADQPADGGEGEAPGEPGDAAPADPETSDA